MARALVALGANLGDRKAALDAAVVAVGRLPDTRITASSAWLQSVHVGGPPQPDYLNGALLVETSLPPLALLEGLQQVEQAGGRVRNEHWGPRTLDLDLLLYDDAILESERLRLPHPRLPFRRFVLEPAVEIAPDWVHPLFGTTLSGLLRHIESTRPYIALLGPPGSGKTRLAREIAAHTGARFLLDPAGSASPEPAGEIEFLARRSNALAARSWPAENRWTVSDFWLPQSLAWWSAEHAEGNVEAIETAYGGYASHAVPARFVVALDVDRSTAERGDSFSERVRLAMDRLTRRGTLPPVLWLASSDWRRALEETLAILAG